MKTTDERRFDAWRHRIDSALPAVYRRIPDLLRRASIPAQPWSYRANSIGGGTPSSDEYALPHADPTLAAAASDPVKDPVGQARDRVMRNLCEIVRLVDDTTAALDLVDNQGSDPKERSSGAPTTCTCCERLIHNTPNDRAKGGLCGACYEDWRTFKLERIGEGVWPEKERWKRDRRRWLAEHGRLTG